MKYIINSKNSKSDYNLVFIYEDKLASIVRTIGKGILHDDFKSAVKQKLVSGKAGSTNVFSSKIYDKNYIFIGLGEKDKLDIQKFEKCLNAVIKIINNYNISSISIDLTDVNIKNYNHIKGAIIEIEKTQYNYKSSTKLTLKECSLKVSTSVTTLFPIFPNNL